MKLTLEKIGAIQKASIELVGLTVIAGENDTGKSTLGKVSFALVQAFSRFPIAVRNNTNARLRKELDRLYFNVRRYFDLSDRSDIRGFFSALRNNTEDLHAVPFNEIESMIKNLLDQDLNHDHNDLRSIFSNSILSLSRDPLHDREEVLNRQLERLRQIVQETVSDEHAIGRLVHQALSSEFAGEIQYVPGDEPASISLADGATPILEMELTNEGVSRFVGGEPLGLRDATLVDGPAIIQFHSTISNYDGIGFAERTSYRNAIPYHVVDLANKLRVSREGLDFGKAKLDRVCNAFEGEVVFDDDLEGFYLRKGNVVVPSVNMASGIKALSIVEMLYRGDYIDYDTLLILDEPETNLHPKWQIEYAKSICELVEKGARILVTTHSPYMLEALKGYCSGGVESKFYLAKRESNNFVNYIDTRGDIASIIETLAKPLADFLEDFSGEDDF